MGLTVPRERMEERIQSGGGGDFVFPVGSYEGVIEEITVRDLPGFVGRGAGPSEEEFARRVREKNNGWASTDLEMLSIQIGQIEVLELSDPSVDVEIGERKFFVPDGRSALTIRDGTHTIDNIDLDADVDYWKLQNGADYVGRMAHALGETEEEGGHLVVRDGFLEDLKNGEPENRGIGFEVDHFGTYESGGKETTDYRIVQFFPAPTKD